MFSELSKWVGENTSDFEIIHEGEVELNTSSIGYNNPGQIVTDDGLFVRSQGPNIIYNPPAEDVIPYNTVVIEARANKDFITCKFNSGSKIKHEVMNLAELNNAKPDNRIDEFTNSTIHQAMPNIVAEMERRGHKGLFSEIRYGMYTYTLIAPKFQGVNGIILCVDSKDTEMLHFAQPKIFRHIPVYCVVTGDNEDKVDENFTFRWDVSSLHAVNDINNKDKLNTLFLDLADQISKDNSENLSPKP